MKFIPAIASTPLNGLPYISAMEARKVRAYMMYHIIWYTLRHLLMQQTVGEGLLHAQCCERLADADEATSWTSPWLNPCKAQLVCPAAQAGSKQHMHAAGCCSRRSTIPCPCAQCVPSSQCYYFAHLSASAVPHHCNAVAP
jgi:hypothetical protein